MAGTERALTLSAAELKAIAELYDRTGARYAIIREQPLSLGDAYSGASALHRHHRDAWVITLKSRAVDPAAAVQPIDEQYLMLASPNRDEVEILTLLSDQVGVALGDGRPREK